MSPQRTAIRVLGIVGCAGALAVAAFGQRTSTIRYSRPAETGASARINQVGGSYTGDANIPLQLLRGARGGVNSVDNTPPALTRGLLPSTGSLGTGAMARSASSLDLPLRASATVTRFRNRSIDTGVIAPQDMAVSSGFAAATRVDTPMSGWRFAPQPIDTPLFAPPPTQPRSAFQEFFGLRPTPDKAGGAAVKGRTVGELIAQNNDLQAAGLVQRAKTAFAQQRFGDAAVLLSAVRSAKEDNALASVAAAHAAMEQQQSWTAVMCLLDAVQRRPTVFADGVDIRSWYKDATSFERTMRAYSRSSAADATWPARVLMAYCAWQLGDRAAAQSAVNGLLDLGNKTNPEGTERALKFAYALKAALK